MNYLQVPPLRIATAGNVDDGKSTLIGRLILCGDGLYEDQKQALRRAGGGVGPDELNLAFITDGLRLERERGITLDVAYRYLSSARRRFIIADCPGHLEYTRNMVSGCANAQALVLVLDAARGISEQTCRHLMVARLFEVPRVIVAVSKMDEVGYSEARFKAALEDVQAYCRKIGLRAPHVIPVSALKNENIEKPSAAMPWWTGPAFLPFLEDLQFQDVKPALRVNVQVMSFKQDRAWVFIESGILRAGSRVHATRAGSRVTIQALFDGPREISEAGPGQAVSCLVESDSLLQRGEVFVDSAAALPLSTHAPASLCWFDALPLEAGREFILRQGTDALRVQVRSLSHAFDFKKQKLVSSPVRIECNGVAGVELATLRPMVLENEFGAFLRKFVLVEPETGSTVAAGVVAGPGAESFFS